MVYETLILKYLNTPVLKLTTEERADGMFIATYWEIEGGYEEDRVVREFETLSMAYCEMYRDALSFISQQLLKSGYKMELKGGSNETRL